MPLTLLSRSSDLAVLQAELVAAALRERWPSLDVRHVTRSSAGDRDPAAPLWTAQDKGLFTADLSDALLSGEADLVVHSWKDLPLEARSGTEVVATLERADPRDVLLVRREIAAAKPDTVTILSSSPRRAWQLETTLRRFLPWPVSTIRAVPVRGNIPTRLTKLLRGDGDGLIVAKAALDRLLSDRAPAEARTAVRDALDRTRWMVLPIREHPTAPAQGALAIEIASRRADLRDRLAELSHGDTWTAVQTERTELAALGGGCHSPIGATMLVRDYGRVLSVRAQLADGSGRTTWVLQNGSVAPPFTDARHIWPRPDERDHDRVQRRPLLMHSPPPADGLWVTRAEALPESWPVPEDRLVWAAGSRTWTRLAARGVWVHGCADGLGDAEPANIGALAGRDVNWRRLTHHADGDPGALVTYAVDRPLPPDLASRTHFFWTSGVAFTEALAAHPGLATAWHGSGPGRTARTIRARIDSPARVSIWLDYDQWHHAVTR